MNFYIMMRLVAKRLFIVFVLGAVVVLPTHAQSVLDKVYAVLFYSPTCPHCHKVITEDLPGIQERFGDQLEVLFINVSTEGGAALTYSACDAYGILEQCGGVPMMIIGEHVLYGALQIPQQMPGIVEAGLAEGGISLPAFPGMMTAYNAMLEQTGAAAPESATAQESSTTAENASAAVSTETQNATLWDKLAADPEANAVAVLVLVGLVFSLGALLRRRDLGKLTPWAVTIGGVIGVVLALSILTADATSTVVTMIALAVITVFGLLMASPVLRERYGVPLVALIGLVVAGYLAHIETTTVTAICGAIGDCNSVQQSDYARVLGIPVGVLGIIGYVLVLVAWGGTTRPQYRQQSQRALLALAVAGALFSVYLTFLEPFVIGATCAWCLLSALAMGLLLWLVAPDVLARSR
ncbi:MAG: hypothetical protein OHK0046_12900 [Anaerolineae bacterium]